MEKTVNLVNEYVAREPSELLFLLDTLRERNVRFQRELAAVATKAREDIKTSREQAERFTPDSHGFDRRAMVTACEVGVLKATVDLLAREIEKIIKIYGVEGFDAIWLKDEEE